MSKKNILNLTVIIISLICLFIVSAFAYSQEISNDLYSNFIRLHVIANSDSSIDQNVKLKVRDRMLEYMRENSINLDNTEDAKILIKNNISELEEIANQVLAENNFDYTATAVLGDFYFPTKEYDDFILPAGNYQSLRILLGKADGQNWWCVMFPPLCFVDSSSTAKTEYKSQLSSNLNDETYKVITSNSESTSSDVKFKFKIAEIFQGNDLDFVKK